MLALCHTWDRATEHTLVTEPTTGILHDAVRDVELVSREGLVGYEAIRYAHGKWQIQVAYPVIPNPDPEIRVSNYKARFAWQGMIRAMGIWETT